MWCIIYAIAGDFSCERIAKMRTNPVSFTIASSDKPFRLQIRVSNLQAEDIVLIDNIVFKGHICANVCINDLDNCPYRSATPNSSTPWMIDQLVNLPQDATKVLFIADGISTNRSLAIDNIRLRSMEGEDFCRQYLQRKSTANNDFPQ
uniref:MAM domain-containing protein n=1 Tax=Ascaris lumbricoides TaxID=6252 RepID=A0A0M3IH43_ASCLU